MADHLAKVAAAVQVAQAADAVVQAEAVATTAALARAVGLTSQRVRVVLVPRSTPTK